MNKTTKYILMVLGIIVGIIAVGFAIGLVLFNLSQKEDTVRMVEVYPGIINVNVKPYNNPDDIHNLQINLFFEISEELSGLVSTASIKRDLRRILAEMDYRQVVSANSTEYITEYIVSWLSDDVMEGEFGNIYITDVHIDELPITSPDEVSDFPVIETKSKRKFGGLFKS